MSKSDPFKVGDELIVANYARKPVTKHDISKPKKTDAKPTVPEAGKSEEETGTETYSSIVTVVMVKKLHQSLNPAVMVIEVNPMHQLYSHSLFAEVGMMYLPYLPYEMNLHQMLLVEVNPLHQLYSHSLLAEVGVTYLPYLQYKMNLHQSDAMEPKQTDSVTDAQKSDVCNEIKSDEVEQPEKLFETDKKSDTMEPKQNESKTEAQKSDVRSKVCEPKPKQIETETVPNESESESIGSKKSDVCKGDGIYTTDESEEYEDNDTNQTEGSYVWTEDSEGDSNSSDKCFCGVVVVEWIYTNVSYCSFVAPGNNSLEVYERVE